MSKELDVSWFDLKKYDALAELDLSGWQRQIEIRQLISYDLEKDSCYDAGDYSASELFKRLKKNPIWTGGTREWDIGRTLNKYPFNTHSVYSTPALFEWFNGNEDRLHHIWECCENVYSQNIEDEKQEDLINTPYDLLIQQAGIGESGKFTNVTVDLTATDEQILGDFKYWLSEYRKATGCESNKNNFSNKDLSCWHKLRLLPYIDVILISPVMELLQHLKKGNEGLVAKPMTQARIANLIFPDYQHIDIVDKLRRTTKPKVEQLFKDKTLKAIEAQLSSSI